MRKYLWIWILGGFLMMSCNGYQKLLQSTDVQQKFDAAMNYYNKKDYFKALPLFEDLLGYFRGTSMQEKIYYHVAMCNYGLEYYTLAAYHFKNFTESYPRSSYAEECYYLQAYCYYKDSQPPGLDPTNTYNALDQLQSFINTYPESNRVQECNKTMDELRGRLQVKSYKNALLYYNIGEYKSAIVAFRNTLKDFPESENTEEMEFLICKSHYKLAANSVEYLQEQRYLDYKSAAKNFQEIYPASKYLKDLEKMNEKTAKRLSYISEHPEEFKKKEETQY